MEVTTESRHGVRASSLLSAILVALSFHACAGTTVSQTVQPQVELSLESDPSGRSDESPTVTTASQDRVVLTGVMATPNPCYTIEASIEAKGQDVTLTLTARSEPRMCVQMLGSFTYNATITGLAAGTYGTRLIYQYPNTGWESKEFSLRLVVP